MMRVLFVSRCLPVPEHYGDRLILRWLLPALRDLGHTCDVIALTVGGDARYLDHARMLCGALETVAERPRRAIDFARRLVGSAPKRAEECWNPALWRAVEQRMASATYDVVHVFGGIQVYEVAPLAQRRPAIITPYESHALLAATARADAQGPIEWLRASAETMIARRFERVMFRGFSSVVVLTSRDRDALRMESPGLPIVVIPNGVRPPSTSGTPRDARTLLFVGNFEYTPNVRAARLLATEILPRVRTRIPDASLLLVGVNPPPEVRAFAGRGVEVTGYVADIAPFMARASTFVAPLTQGAGLKNKILEAMAHGVPVVTTPIGIDGIAARDNVEALVRTGSDQLAAAVVELLLHPGRRAALAGAARMLVERDHSWDTVARQYQALYMSTIAAHASQGAATR